jgi:hypothetical protein
MCTSASPFVGVRDLFLGFAWALLATAQAQETPAFSFRMVFTRPATDSTYAAEHRIRQVIKTRDSDDPSS